jgi:hypothetical protein
MKAPALVLIRGMPGSGKTTLAQAMERGLDVEDVPCVHLETDMFFTDDEGNYHFDKGWLSDAHEWCLATFKQHILSSVVIVSNTFSTQKEMDPYLRWASGLYIPIQVIECHGFFGSKHDVPESTLRRMRNRWQGVFIPNLSPRTKSNDNKE